MTKFLYGNPTMIDVIMNIVPENIKIIDCSKIVFSYGYSARVIIEVEDGDVDKLLAIGADMWDEVGGWFREVTDSNTWFDPYRPRVMRKVGIHEYICDAVPESLGASQPRNVAAVIGAIAAHEGKTPIQLFNSL